MSTDSRWSSSRNSQSDQSAGTQSTAPTEYSARTPDTKFIQEDDLIARLNMAGKRQHSYHEPRKESCESYASYASTAPSEAEVSVLDLVDSYEVLSVPDSGYTSNAIASSPRDFAQLFPSAERISIRHDDSTLDGNMNLRLDTWIPTRHGKRRPMTLFHLRMLDLARRDFSLRRYCRDSGREVCKSSRKYHETCVEQKPSLQRTLSNAIASLRRRDSIQPPSNLASNRIEDGFDSMDRDDELIEPSYYSRSKTSKHPTKTIKLEFSNYAHVDVHRHGSVSSKRYDFDYWGVHYSWRRQVKQDGDFTAVSFHLFRDGSTLASAHIVPDALTTWQAQQERNMGGWIPPCSMWLKDPAITDFSPDIADVVISTGLMALVDDCIKTTWPSRRRTFNLPLFRSPFYLDLQYIGPKQLIDEVFGRPMSSRRHAQRAPLGYN